MAKRLICFLCMLVCSVSMLASCKDADVVPDSSQDNKTVADNVRITYSPLKTGEFNMEDLILYEERNPTQFSEKQGIDYILCVLRDGSVYYISYCYSSIQEKENIYEKFTSCDNSVWNLIDEVEYLGKLSDEDIPLLNESIANVDKNSEYIEAEVWEQVVTSAYYSIYCFISDNSGNRKLFKISSSADHGKTSDENAREAWGIVRKNDVYKRNYQIYGTRFDSYYGTLYPVKPNVLLFAESIYQESNDMGQNVFLLCVLKDGAVYSIKYCNSPDVGKFDFFEKFDIGDERPLKLIKSLVENFEVEFLGVLSDEEIKTVKDRIEKTDADSDYIRKKKGKNVIKDADYNVYCYVSDKSDKKKKVNIIKSQNKKKKYRKISDKNATAAWKLVGESDIFKKWKAGVGD